MSFAALSSAIVAELPAERYATGGAFYSCVRQLGAVLGISILVAVLGAHVHALSSYHHAWLLIAADGALAAVMASGLGRFYAREEVPVPVARPTFAPGLGEGGPL